MTRVGQQFCVQVCTKMLLVFKESHEDSTWLQSEYYSGSTTELKVSSGTTVVLTQCNTVPHLLCTSIPIIGTTALYIYILFWLKLNCMFRDYSGECMVG